MMWAIEKRASGELGEEINSLPNRSKSKIK
jgi:hypothetical protein